MFQHNDTRLLMFRSPDAWESYRAPGTISQTTALMITSRGRLSGPCAANPEAQITNSTPQTTALNPKSQSLDLQIVSHIAYSLLVTPATEALQILPGIAFVSAPAGCGGNARRAEEPHVWQRGLPCKILGLRFRGLPCKISGLGSYLTV